MQPCLAPKIEVSAFARTEAANPSVPSASNAGERVTFLSTTHLSRYSKQIYHPSIATHCALFTPAMRLLQLGANLIHKHEDIVGKDYCSERDSDTMIGDDTTIKLTGIGSRHCGLICA